MSTFLSSTHPHAHTHIKYSGLKTNEQKKVQAVEEDANLLEPSGAGSDAVLDSVRTARETNNLSISENNKITVDQAPQPSEKAQDQQAAPAENASTAADELTLESLEDDENRGKRFVFMIDERNARPN